MELMINYDENSKKFSAEGRPSGITSCLGNIGINDFVWYSCYFNFKCYATVDHIVPYNSIRNLVISLINDYISLNISYDEYKKHMTNLWFALGKTSSLPDNLPKNIRSFYNSGIQSFYNSGTINLSLLSDAIGYLKYIISSFSGKVENMIYGYPKTNELINMRMDFPLADIAYGYLEYGTALKDSVKGGTYNLLNKIQVAYVTGNSWKRLDTLLSLPFAEGELSVLLTGLGEKKENCNLYMVSSQNLLIETKIRYSQGDMFPPSELSYFAHQMATGEWLIFQRNPNDMEHYSIFTAIP